MENFILDKLNEYIEQHNLDIKKEEIASIVEKILEPFEGNLKDNITFDYGTTYKAVICYFTTKEGYHFRTRYEMQNKDEESIITFTISYSKDCLYDGWDTFSKWDEHVKNFLKRVRK